MGVNGDGGEWILPESKGQNLALAGLLVIISLGSGGTLSGLGVNGAHPVDSLVGREVPVD